MNQTEAQRAYKRFDRRSKLISTALLAVGVLCLGFVLICERLDSLIGLLVSIAALAAWFVALCVIVTRLNKTRIHLHHQAYGADEDSVHTGLFGELKQEFEWNQFEGMTDAKVIFAEAHGNTIELELRRSSRTIHIAIDPVAALLVIEEESADPKEIELYLSDFADTSQLFISIRNIVEHP